MAEYACAQGLEREPPFNWWVSHVIKKRKIIISKVKSRARYLKKNDKYGIKIPRNVAETKTLGRENGNTLWQDTITKELANASVAFKTLGINEKLPRGYQFVKCHMIFMLRWKVLGGRLVTGGHLAKAPAAVTYTSVVSRETVRIVLTIAALNEIEVKCGDVMNAYITAPCTERIRTTLGAEFGTGAGKRALIVRELYDLKSSGAAFRKHLGECMRGLNYFPCLADPDV